MYVCTHMSSTCSGVTCVKAEQLCENGHVPIQFEPAAAVVPSYASDAPAVLGQKTQQTSVSASQRNTKPYQTRQYLHKRTCKLSLLLFTSTTLFQTVWLPLPEHWPLPAQLSAALVQRVARVGKAEKGFLVERTSPSKRWGADTVWDLLQACAWSVPH